MTAPIDDAAARLAVASMTRTPCAPVRDLIDPADVTAAYRVQTHNVKARIAACAHVVGRKIGLTSPAVQAQLGVDRPDFGVLLDDMDVSHLPFVPFGRLLQPKVEAELAFVLGADARPAYALAALEIVDSRISGWDITFADTVADNASSGLFVLGDQRLDPGAFAPRDVEMTLWVDGVGVSQGRGTAAWVTRSPPSPGSPRPPNDSATRSDPATWCCPEHSGRWSTCNRTRRSA